MTSTPSALSRAWPRQRTAPGRLLDPVVQPRGVHRCLAATGTPPGRAADTDAEVARGVQRRHRACGLDQGLGRHAVGEHAGTAKAVGIGHDDLGAELRGDQGGLVSARTSADDRDARACLAHASFWRIWRRACEAARHLAHRAACGRLDPYAGDPWPCTPRTAATWTPRRWPSGARIRRSRERVGWRVAADLRRRGNWLGRRAGDGRGRRRRAGLRRALRRLGKRTRRRSTGGTG